MSEFVRIINTKSSTVGFRKRDELREPIRGQEDERLLMLERFHEFFVQWEKNGKGCSAETFLSLRLMCRSLVAIARYLLDECHFEYVLLGQIQSDPIERRFGRIRQMSGANFFISVKQFLDSERKIKIHSLLHHTGLTIADLGKVQEKPASGDDDCDTAAEEEVKTLSQCVDFSMQLEENELNVTYMTGGYAARHVSRTSACADCSTLLTAQNAEDPLLCEAATPTALLDNIDRGGLTRPSSCVFIVCCLSYMSFACLKDSPHFHLVLTNPDAKSLFVSVVCECISLSEHSPILDTLCSSGHSFRVPLRRVIATFFNILAKNFVRERHTSSATSVRKIAKLQSDSV